MKRAHCVKQEETFPLIIATWSEQIVNDFKGEKRESNEIRVGEKNRVDTVAADYTSELSLNNFSCHFCEKREK